MRSLSNYHTLGKAIKFFTIKQMEVSPFSENLSEILQKHPKLVIACAHGPALGPIAAIAGFMNYFNEVGGGNRIPFAVTWKPFYEMAFMKHMARYITQIDKVGGVEDFAEKLQGNVYNDFWVAPEGDHCNFGNGVDIQSFVSPRFIEIAIKANVPILLAIHQGSENWATPINVSPTVQNLLSKTKLPQRYLNQIEETNTLSFSKFFRTRLDALRLSFALYHPKLTLDDLAEDKTQRMEQLWAEAEDVRALMQAHIDQIKLMDSQAAAA